MAVPAVRICSVQPHRHAPFAAAGVVLTAAAVAVIDLFTPAAFLAPVLFVVPVLLTGWIGDVRAVWATTAGVLLLSILGWHRGAGSADVEAVTAANRVSVAAVLTASAACVHLALRCVRAEWRRREEEQARRSAEEQNARKSRFLAAATHDLRAPANAVGLLAETLGAVSARSETLDCVPPLVGELRASVRQLNDLIGDVLDVSALEAGRLVFHDSEFPIAELVAEECRLLAPAAARKGLRLGHGPAGFAVRVRADRVKLGRAVANLISNAVKFTDAGEVQATVCRDPAGLCVAVADTGPGLSAERSAGIFEAFAQGPHRRGGVGLGLSITREIVEAMGGTVAVRSEPGRGSVFRIRLPPSRVVDPVPLTPTLPSTAA